MMNQRKSSPFDSVLIDLHMHSRISDGSDSPEEILARVKEAGIGIFSLTDHDAVEGCRIIRSLLSPSEKDPLFIPGVEFSCKDSEGKYHILGYGYDPESEPINKVVDMGHEYRMNKVRGRLDMLRQEFGFDFPSDEIDELLALPNPGKPHIGNLMVKYGYAESKEQAIREYIDKAHFKGQYVKPEEAIEGILGSGGIPVLAHPFYGSGDQLILGQEMEERLVKLKGYGLRGVEAFYSGFTDKLRNQMIEFADKYDLYITAGSDYHGTNKWIDLGDNGLGEGPKPERMVRFLELMV